MKAALVAVVLSLFAVSSLAQVAVYAAESSACGPVQTKFVVTTDSNPHTLQQPEPGKALVYVIEDQKFRAWRDVTARVGLDGTWIGANLGDSYFFFSVEPGEHHLCTDWVSGSLPNGRLVSLAPLTAEAGRTYYFRVRTSGGKGSTHDYESSAEGASIDLDPINSDEGKLLVESSVLSVSHPKK